ncbi:MAG: TIGR01777 family oxidoreductase [Deferrisomatales bacterium]|nr:TIGR01777 family oxidoreductase [Deferrisomatales bacterium]
MRIFVTGGTGFVGARLVPFLAEQGHEVSLLLRPVESKEGLPAGVRVTEGDPTKEGPWWDGLRDCDAAVNLAGAPIFGRWNEQKKELIRESRVRTTRNLVTALPAGKPFSLLSTSAVGIYGDAGDRELDESAPLGDDFLAHVARDWEAEAARARGRGARVALTRFGIVLGPGGGALATLEKVTRRFLGGPVGTGRQWFSWIHREDLVRALLFLLERPDQEGVFNLCAPNPVRQLDVARALGRVLRRPALTPAPALAVRLVLGEFADAVLFSQRMVPRRLQAAGFGFLFPELEPALREVLVPTAP